MRRRLFSALMLLTAARLVMNSAHRMVSPFLPVIARGLGIPLETAGVLVAARSAAAMATPLIVTVGRRHDRRRLAQIGIASFAIGSSITALAGVYPGVLAGFALMGLSKAVFDVSGQAYLSDRTPYASRARWLGIFETTWAAGFLVGAPAAGWIIASWGWERVYLVFALTLTVVVAASTRLLEPDHTEMREIGRLSLDRSAAALLVVGGLLAGGGELVTVVLGAWLEDVHGVLIAGLAGLAALIGVAEFVGAGSTSVLTDRLGKRRSVALGLLITSIGYAVLALFGGRLAPGIVGALVAFLGFEFTIVSTFPLASELVPGGRGRYLAWLVVAVSVGRTLAGVAGPRVYLESGFSANGLTAVVLNVVALAVLWLLVAEPAESALSRSPARSSVD